MFSKLFFWKRAEADEPAVIAEPAVPAQDLFISVAELWSQLEPKRLERSLYHQYTAFKVGLPHYDDLARQLRELIVIVQKRRYLQDIVVTHPITQYSNESFWVTADYHYVNKVQALTELRSKVCTLLKAIDTQPDGFDSLGDPTPEYYRRLLSPFVEQLGQFARIMLYQQNR